MPHRQPADNRQCITLEIGLVPVDNEYLLTGFRMAQDQSLLSPNAILFDPVMARGPNIVVTENDVQPVVAVESVQQVKGAPVRLHDVAEASAFPHLVTIPSLNVGEPGTVVVVHSVKVQLFIPSKDVRLAAVPTMAVAEKDYF
jgi:hypothetical protein